MSLFGSVSCFVIGTYAEISVLSRVFQGHFTHTNSTLLIGKVVGGIDYYLIGIALLIFGYGIYELVISDIDPRQQEASDVRRNMLNIESLDGLKQKLTTITELLMFCAGVLMLAFSAWLRGQTRNH